MSKDNIMDKIRKLLAMADKNSGASENEMMTAMAMAQALMRRHHLSQRLVQRSHGAASTSVELSQLRVVTICGADPRPAVGTKPTSRLRRY